MHDPPGKVDTPGVGRRHKTRGPALDVPPYCSNLTLSAVSSNLADAPNEEEAAARSKRAGRDLKSFIKVTSKMFFDQFEDVHATNKSIVTNRNATNDKKCQRTSDNAF